MGNEPMDEIMTTSPSQLMRRAVQERDAEIRQHIEEMVGRLSYPQHRTQFAIGRASMAADLLAWIGDTDGD